jgi:hypothetical protein
MQVQDSLLFISDAFSEGIDSSGKESGSGILLFFLFRHF